MNELMTKNGLETLLRKDLDPDERIIWSCRPDKKQFQRFLNQKFNSNFLFCFMVLSGHGYFLYKNSFATDNLFFWIPFLFSFLAIFSFYKSFRRVLYNNKIAELVLYALTTERMIIFSPSSHPKLTSIVFDWLYLRRTAKRVDNTGDIEVTIYSEMGEGNSTPFDEHTDNGPSDLDILANQSKLTASRYRANMSEGRQVFLIGIPSFDIAETIIEKTLRERGYGFDHELTD